MPAPSTPRPRRRPGPGGLYQARLPAEAPPGEAAPNTPPLSASAVPSAVPHVAPSAGLPRLFNLTAATLGLCVLAPFLSLIWVLIRLDSPGPCLFRQPRIGGGGRRFVCYKFRTMTLETTSEPVAIEDFDSFVFSPPRTRPDPRVTWLGAVLRQTSVDELPQLLNVVRGQMALIGPRPELPQIVEQYPPAYHERHAVLPGVSGLAQISGRSNLTYAEIASCDLEYVNRRSAWLDMALLWRTVAAVARGEGAR